MFGDNPERIRSEAASCETLRHLPHPRCLQDKPTGTVSTEADTTKPTQRCTN